LPQVASAPCYLCDEAATRRIPGLRDEVTCPTCGSYVVTRRCLLEFDKLTPEHRKRLSRLAREAYNKGERLLLTAENIGGYLTDL
jgi:hypothetical protein